MSSPVLNIVKFSPSLLPHPSVFSDMRWSGRLQQIADVVDDCQPALIEKGPQPGQAWMKAELAGAGTRESEGQQTALGQRQSSAVRPVGVECIRFERDDSVPVIVAALEEDADQGLIVAGLRIGVFETGVAKSGEHRHRAHSAAATFEKLSSGK
jgi:hypothetical protein